MAGRIGWSAAGVSFATGATFALFEVQGWTMWPPLAIGLLVVLIAAGLIFALVLLHGLWEIIASWRANFGLRWPIFRTDSPDPNQWLHDATAAQLANVASHLYVVEQSVDLTFLEYDEPYIVVTYWIRNGAIVPIGFGQDVKGKSSVMGRELKDALELTEGGGNRWGPGHQGRLRLRQYVSKETAQQLREYVSLERSQSLGGYLVVPMLQGILRVQAQISVFAWLDDRDPDPPSALSLSGYRPELFVVSSSR